MNSSDDEFEVTIPDMEVTSPTKYDINLKCSFCFNLPCFECIVTIIVYYYEALIECFN